jgi:hypothetical protein
VAEAVKVADWPLQIVAELAVSDRLVGTGFTVIVAGADTAPSQPLEFFNRTV